MAWFRKKDMDSRKVDALHQAVSHSFENVRKDTHNIYRWLDYLHKRHSYQDQLIQQLRQELQYLPKTREDLRRILDEHYSNDHLIKRIREIEDKVEAVSRRQTIVPAESHTQSYVQSHIVPGTVSKLDELHSRLEKLEQKKNYFKEKIIRKITKSSKDYVKSHILGLIRKYEKIAALQLKEMLVDEQRLCSKSSFYRLLEELEDEKDADIAVIKEGKEKMYMAKALKNVK